MKKNVIKILFLACAPVLYGQGVGINTVTLNNRSVLDIVSMANNVSRFSVVQISGLEAQQTGDVTMQKAYNQSSGTTAVLNPSNGAYSISFNIMGTSGTFTVTTTAPIMRNIVMKINSFW